MTSSTAVSSKEDDKKKFNGRRKKSSVDLKEETSKSTTSKSNVRKRSSASLGERLPAETEAAVADFVRNHTDLAAILKEPKQLTEQVIVGEEEHKRCCQMKERNRYESVPCLDASRVAIQQETSGGSDFIHANKCKFDGVERQYIIAQTPMKNTLEDFWRMVFQEQSSTIVVLCDFYEGIGKEPAEAFWPLAAGQYTYYGKMFINNKKTELAQGKDDPDTYVVEVLPDGCSNSLLTTILHARWHAGQPHCTQMVIKMLKHKHNGGPMTVVSSEGIGRSASYVAVDVMMTRVFKGQKTRMQAIATELRKQRALAFNNDIYYMYAVEVLLKYIKVRVRKHSADITKYLNSFNEELKSSFGKT